MKNFSKNNIEIPDQQKNLRTIAHKNQHNWGFACSGGRLTLIMGRFGGLGKPRIIAHENRQNRGFACSGAHFTLKMGRFGLQLAL
ncbi:hypothetical protein H5410_062346 [Solanum commersonii]|uniref:Uncharacterized protein n=1 Tax=Solanum commersonii TaxID=4109 RepID=A0A9J5WBB6_SOLCO|nr:hypothetical protein H5410_062346 [Solanum commersonii]